MSNKLLKEMSEVFGNGQPTETDRLGKTFHRYYRPVDEWQSNDELEEVEPPLLLKVVGFTELGFLLIAPKKDVGGIPNTGFLSFEEYETLKPCIVWEDDHATTVE